MKKLYNLLFVLAVPALFLLFTSEVLYHSGSPGGKTGSPGDGGSNCTDCHAGTPVNEELWIYSTDLLLQDYEPNETYDIIVIGVDSDANKIGFEATAEDESGNKVGTFEPDMVGFTQVLNGGSSITHTALGSNPIADTGTVFFFTWVAPPTYVGDVTFYAAINTANGNGSNSGDQIHLSQFTTGSLGVGVAENKQTDFKIYPNPSDGIVHVDRVNSTDTELHVLNINGQVVKNQQIQDYKNRIDLTALEAGVYFVKIGDKTQRIIIR